jgi:hypothetical protein
MWIDQFVFFPDTLTPYNLQENRNFNTTGLKLDYSIKASEHVQFKFGALASIRRARPALAELRAAHTGDHHLVLDSACHRILEAPAPRPLPPSRNSGGTRARGLGP